LGPFNFPQSVVYQQRNSAKRIEIKCPIKLNLWSTGTKKYLGS